MRGQQRFSLCRSLRFHRAECTLVVFAFRVLVKPLGCEHSGAGCGVGQGAGAVADGNGRGRPRCLQESGGRKAGESTTFFANLSCCVSVCMPAPFPLCLPI